MLKFRGSKFSRIAVFEDFIEIFSRILKHAIPTYVWVWLFHELRIRTYMRSVYTSHISCCHMPTFEVKAMVHGYHAYQDSWNALIGEELLCAREPDNLRDFSNTPYPHMYGCGYFTSCAYVRTCVAYIPRTSLAVTCPLSRLKQWSMATMRTRIVGMH